MRLLVIWLGSQFLDTENGGSILSFICMLCPEQDTLSAVLHSSQLTDGYQIGASLCDVFVQGYELTNTEMHSISQFIL